MKLKLKNVIFNVIVVYNPKKELIYNCISELEGILEKLGNTNTIIVGDFNVNIAEQEKETDEYECFLANKGYTIRNTLITRPASNALLDHISTNIAVGHLSIFTVENALSDHNILIWALSKEDETEEMKMTEIKSINFREVQDSIEENMEGIMNQDNANSISRELHVCIRESLEKSTNTRERKSKWKKLNPWSTKELAILSLEKQSLYKKKIRYPSNQTIEAEYRRVNNKINDLRRKLKREYCEKELRNSIEKNKSIWEVIKGMAGVGTSYGSDITEIRKDDVVYRKKEDIANIMNDFYINVGPNLSAAMEDPNEQTYTHIQAKKSMQLEPATEENIAMQINRLSNKNSSPNGISNTFMKRMKTALTPIVTRLINKSFEEGVFPDESKETQVIPIFKQGDHMDPGNYRPISILSGISRVQEGIMKIRLERHLADVKFHNNAQYGFRTDKDIQDWFVKNKLSLNIKKTNYIVFKRPLWNIPETTIKIENQEVSRVASVKYLGIIIDEHLTWNEHIKKIVPQLKAAAGLIYRLRKVLDVSKLKLLYYAYFHSHMCYLSSFWGISNSKHFKKISTLQNGVLKSILGVERRFSTKL
ncbi:hypothetical protein KUF71_002736, partial [Frankliniella fusca]